MSDRVLITGFKPFLGEAINPSEVLLAEIKRDFAVYGNVDTLVLPVSFNHAFTTLEKQVDMKSYRYVFLLGQAGDRDKVCFERVGLNWVETQKPDEDGFIPHQGPISQGASAALFSRFPLSEWSEDLKGQGVPAKVSLSAGGYVCNYVYFRALQKYQETQDTAVVFIHVPYLPDQVQNKPPGTPFLDLETMKTALYAVLKRYIK